MLTDLSNDIGLWILLFALVVDITTSEFDILNSLFLVRVFLLLLLVINSGEVSTTAGYSCDLFLCLDSLASAFRFGAAMSNGYLVNNFASCSNSLM